MKPTPCAILRCYFTAANLAVMIKSAPSLQGTRVSVRCPIELSEDNRSHGHHGYASNADQRLRHEIIPAQVQNCVRRKREQNANAVDHQRILAALDQREQQACPQ